MRIRLTLDVERRRPDQEPEPREVQLDAMVERGEQHPEVERPIGFRRNGEEVRP